MSVKLTKSILVYGVCAGISQSLLIFLLPAYTDVLSPDKYGIYELIYAGFLLLNLLGMSQIDSAVSRFFFEAETKEERFGYIKTSIVIITALSVFIGLLTYLFSNLLSIWLFSSEEYSVILKLVGATIPIVNIYNLLLIIARFDDKPMLFGFAAILQVLATASLTIYLLFNLNYAIEGIFFANLIGYLVGAILLLIYYREVLFVKYDKNITKQYFSFSLPLFPAVIGSWLNNHISKFLMILYLSKGQLGIFTAALKVASILKFGDYVFRMAWTPFYLKEIKSANHKELFSSVLNKLLLFFAIGMVLFHYIKIPLSRVLFSNDEFYLANEFISPLAFCIVLTTLVQIVGMGPIIAKKTIYNTYNFLVSISVFFISFFTLVPLYGVHGAVFSQLLSSITLLVVSWYNSNKLYPINFNKLYTLMFILGVLIIIYCF